MFGNLVDDDQPPHFYQVNFGYQLTPKDRLSVQAITWRYYHPLGIPYGESRESPDKAYPGHVREYGVGLEYQRLLPKGFYTSISAIPFFRRYYNTENEKIGDGMQLYLTGRVGYHSGCRTACTSSRRSRSTTGQSRPTYPKPSRRRTRGGRPTSCSSPASTSASASDAERGGAVGSTAPPLIAFRSTASKTTCAPQARGTLARTASVYSRGSDGGFRQLRWFQS